MLMIKINLIPQPKKLKVGVIMGVDIKKIKWNLLLFSLVFLFATDLLDLFYFDSRLGEKERQISETQTIINEINNEIRENRNIKEMLEAFNEQVEKLKSKETQVKTLLSSKTNPYKILIQLSRSMNDEVWLEYLDINASMFTSRGSALTYKSIDNFIQRLNESIFFNNSIRIKSTDTKEISQGGNLKRRVENFEIYGLINRYE